MLKLLSVLSVVLFSNVVLAEPVTVPHVDLDRYLGTWYEIASIPQRFSKGCHCTRAQYSLKDNGNIKVFNSCNKDSVDGKLSKAVGTAKVVDAETNSKLRVSFFWPFAGDYWIIGLDAEYRYAVVSNREASSLWILSRTPQLDPELYQEAVSIAIANGVDLSKAQAMPQNGCTYPR